MKQKRSSLAAVSPNFLIAAVLCAGLLLSGPAVSGESEQECVVEKNLAYLGPDRGERLDVYLPPKNDGAPSAAILLIHGGGWSKGDKADPRESSIAKELAKEGYAVFSINYSLEKTERTDQGKGHISVRCWPQNILDCKTALLFISQSANRYNIDPKRTAIIGFSAGAHLALLTGLTSEIESLNPAGFLEGHVPKPACLISFYGVTDVRSFASYHFAGEEPGQRAANLDLASPILHLAETSPPVLVVHGNADKTVPVTQSQAFVKRLGELNVEHEYVEIPDAPHSFSIDYAKFDIRGALLAFLKKYLSPTQTPSSSP